MNELFAKAILVEDEEAHALLVKRILKDFVSEVVHCTTVAAAVEKLGVFNPDIIVSDLHLPDASNTQVIQSLQAAAPNVPILVLTSSTLLEDAVEAMKAGARDFIVKNFNSNFREAFGLSLDRVYAAHAMERERQKLLREMGVLRLAIENGNDALAIVRGDGAIDYCNKAFEGFLGMCGGNTQDVTSMFSPQVKRADTLSTVFRENLAQLGPGAVWSTEIAFTDNTDVFFDLSLTVVAADAGAGVAEGSHEFVLWARDVSVQKKRERFQREILSTTTHDLKGPLGAIIISSELLQDALRDIGGKPYEISLRVGSAAKGAVNLIDEFLSARRIQEGTFVLKPMAIDLATLVKDAVEDFRTIAAAKSIRLEVIEPEAPLSLKVDKIGFTRVLGNLLSNACKFTPRGGKITVTCSLKGEEAHVAVTDTGCGIEPTEFRKLFSKFSRLEKHSGVSGSGIGLFVVKAIVSAHGGRVDVLSKVGEGTTFEIILPLEPPVNERGELIALDFA